MLGAIIPLALFVLLLIGVIGAVRGAWQSAFVSKKYSTPRCPACRYEIDQALPIARCPECGRDLRVAGVLTPELTLRLRGSVGSIWGGVGLVTLIAGIVLGIIALVLIDTTGPRALWIFVGGLVAPVPVGVWTAVVLHRRRRRVLAGSQPTHPRD